jgi:drug/metabolite transporter (DMT)-like permease
MSNNNQSQGIIWMLIFCLAAVIADAVVRYLTIADIPAAMLMFIRSVVGALILLPIIIKRRSLSVPRKILKLHFVRTIFIFINILIWFHIIKYVELTSLIAIGFTSPLFATILAILFLGEKYSHIKIASLLIGFSGAMVVINPFGINFNIYLLFAILASLAWAISLIYAKRLADKQTPIEIAFFVSLFLIPLTFTLAVPFWYWPKGMEWFYIMIYIISATIAFIAMGKAFEKSEISLLLPFEYSQLIFAAIFSYIIFSEIATFNTLLGGAIILASGYLIIRAESKRKHKAQDLELMP